MRSLLHHAVLFFLPMLAYGQTHIEEAPHALKPANELKGNSILFNSEKIRNAQNEGMTFLSFEVKDIELTYTEEVVPVALKKVEFQQNKGLIQFTASGNCGYSFLGEIEITGDTLNLIYKGYGSNCFGSCLFSFQYEVQKDIANEHILTLKYITINGDLSTKTALSKKFVN